MSCVGCHCQNVLQSHYMVEEEISYYVHAYSKYAFTIFNSLWQDFFPAFYLCDLAFLHQQGLNYEWTGR